MIPTPLEDADIAARTDTYFNRTRAIVSRFGDRRVTYAVFLRRPVVCAPALMVEWLQAVAQSRGEKFDIELTHPEGAGWGPASRWPISPAVSPHWRIWRRYSCRKSALPALPRITPSRCAWRCRKTSVPRHGCAPLRRR
jgi:hypothetical protein